MSTPEQPNPWLVVPLADYEAHMRCPAVHQLEPLADLFAQVLRLRMPASVAILGIAGGNGLDRVDPNVTRRVVGVDINPEYLSILRSRFGGMRSLELHCADLANKRLDLPPVDLVHAALIFEHAGTDLCLENALSLVASCGCLSVVLQLPSQADRAVGSSNVESVTRFADHFHFVDPDNLGRRIADAGFRRSHTSTTELASGKAFWLGVFERLH